MCEECERKEASLLQRKSLSAQEATANLPLVNEVIKSSGHPLDGGLRQWIEPRFGQSFAHVRVHTDDRAAQSATALNALAYTVNGHIAFAAGQYQPESATGRKLIAHELAHVRQQPELGSQPSTFRVGPATCSAEVEADRVAANAVSSEADVVAPSALSAQESGLIRRQATPNPVNCTPNQQGAPANPEPVIQAAEVLGILGTTVASMDLSMLQLEATLPGVGAGGGFTMPAGQRLQNYTNRFGLPPAAGAGKFKNRLSGSTFSSQAQALVEESKSLQTRYERISDFLGGSSIRFQCITGKPTIGTCKPDCSIQDAFGCPPNLILLCPSFWNIPLRNKGQLLIHEAAHAIFNIKHTRNFNHADCYAAFAADAQGGASPTKPPCAP
jgi:hypothetical protein